jgi:hypothetical protein
LQEAWLILDKKRATRDNVWAALSDSFNLAYSFNCLSLFGIIITNAALKVKQNWQGRTVSDSIG